MVGARPARISQQRSVAALVATKNRHVLLCERSLPSIRKQLRPPDLVVLVNDGEEWSSMERARIRSTLNGLNTHLTANSRTPGAGGAWNSGLAALGERGFTGFVVFLDDDDEWGPDHVSSNLDAAQNLGANIVVSGLRMCGPAGDIPRPLAERLVDRDFLTGNPGWQGSNTFVDFALLSAVGGFRESLASLHDRDLAVRLLRHPSARPCLVPRWTATWWADRPGRLSDRRGDAKLRGLRTFWDFYSGEMSEGERRAYLKRAEELFGFTSDEVVGRCGVTPGREHS
jgi:glycosyltransferase involved in cell wall biosynthesis